MNHAVNYEDNVAITKIDSARPKVVSIVEVNAEDETFRSKVLVL